MKILITGGTGYIGYSLCRGLLDRMPGIQIIIYDNLSRNTVAFFTHDRMSPSRVTFINGDILDTHKLEKVLEDVEVVFHLAAKVSHPGSDLDSDAYEQVNHWGTSGIVDAILNNGTVKHLIYVSSTSVYGSSEEPKSEEDTVLPDAFYSTSKWRGEKQIDRLKDQCKVHILRAGNVYGYNPCFRLDSVINKFVFEAHFGKRIMINGDGNQIRSIIHIDKLISVLCQLMTAEVAPGLYNLAEHHFSIKEIISYLQKMYPKLEYLSINQHLKMKHINVKTPCKILDQVDFPEIPFDEELRMFKKSFAF